MREGGIMIRDARRYAPRCRRCNGIIVPVPSPFWDRDYFHWPFPRLHRVER